MKVMISHGNPVCTNFFCGISLNQKSCNIIDLDISFACRKGWMLHLDLNEVLRPKTSLLP
jgi:hypothetical protein